MKKVLIIGHTNKMGGVETFIKNTTLRSNKEKLQYYFLVHGYETCLFKDEIENFYGRECFTFIPSIKKKPLKTILMLNEFYKSHHDFDYIHLQTGAASEIVYTVPFSIKYNIPLIVHSHNGGNLTSSINHQLFIPIVNKFSDIKLSCSKLAAEYMFGKDKAEEAIIIPVGIDLNKFKYNHVVRKEFRERFDIGKDTFVIGVVGRFTQQKNQLFAIRIYKEFIKQYKNSLLILKGQGELEENLRKTISELGLSKKVLMINRLDCMSDMYSAMDVFFMPSLFEGLPQVAVEAQANGLPCVFSDNISKEVDLSENNVFVNLENSNECWVSNLNVKIDEMDRYKGYDILKNKGYDISDTIKKLEEVYNV